MPKDYLNFRLTGETAMDWTEAGSSFMSDPEGGRWSPHAMRALDLPDALLPPLLPPEAAVGRITRQKGINHLLRAALEFDESAPIEG